MLHSSRSYYSIININYDIMSLRKEFKDLEKEFDQTYSAEDIQAMRAEAKHFSLDEYIKKHPILKRFFLLALRVLAILPFTGPIADIALNGAVEILERETK